MPTTFRVAFQHYTAHLSVKLDLTEIKLRLGDEESAERVVGQQFDDQIESPWVGSPRGDPVLDLHCQDVAKNTLPCVASRPYRKFADANGEFYTIFFSIVASAVSIVM